MFEYYSSFFGDKAKRFGYLPVEMAKTDFPIMVFVCYILTAEYGAANFFCRLAFDCWLKLVVLVLTEEPLRHYFVRRERVSLIVGFHALSATVW